MIHPFMMIELGPENAQEPRKTMRKRVKKHTFFLENELHVSTKIMTIPFYSRYFSPTLSYSPVKLSEIDKETHHIGYITETSPDKYILVTSNKNIDNSFHNVFYNPESRINHNKCIIQILNSYKYLLNSLELMGTNNIVHLNICPQTIGFDEHNIPRIHNFEHSFTFSNTIDERKSNLITSDCEYIYPLEIAVIRFINNRANMSSLSSSNIDEICAQFFDKGLGPLSLLSNIYISKLKAAALLSLRPYINKSPAYIIQKMMSHYRTWDNYGLSILYLILMRDISTQLGSASYDVLLSDFCRLLVQNIHPEPKERYTCLQTMHNFNSLLGL